MQSLQLSEPPERPGVNNVLNAAAEETCEDPEAIESALLILRSLWQCEELEVSGTVCRQGLRISKATFGRGNVREANGYGTLVV